MTNFTQLGLAEPILKALAAKGYEKPSPIQAKAIPSLLEGRDLCGIAQTGTGKTAAFALPSLHYFHNNPKPSPLGGCRMLVLSPTRELASQIADSFRTYSRFMRLTVETVFGGVPIGKQIQKMRAGVDILVATPGRLLDLIDQRALSLKHVEIFVLDEADQMMDLGFIVPIKKIDKLLPRDRQSLFFSATMPKAIAELGDRFLTDPVKVSVAPQSTTAERVRQYVTLVNAKEKQALLTLTLKNEPIERALIFTRTKHGADRVVKHLHAADIGAAAIHGNKSQAQRTAALGAFRKGEIKFLVATDIAARGIDVPGVSHVFNFEMPNVPEQYVHRIGRTARAGAEGVSISFVDGEEKNWLRQIERLTGVKLEPVALPENFLAEAAKLPKAAPSTRSEQPRGHGPRGGERRHDGRAAPAGAAEKPKRPFRRRRGPVGAHKGAVKKFGGR